MKKFVIGRRTRITAIRRPFLVKGLTVICLFALIVKLAVYLGGETLAEGVVSRLVQSEGTALGILDFELYGTVNIAMPPELSTIFYESSEFSPELELAEKSIGTETELALPEPEDTYEAVPEPDGGELFYGAESPGAGNSEPAKIVGGGSSGEGIVLNNTTSYDIDVQGLLEKPLDIALTEGEPSVLIIHTHTSEAYTPSDGNTYEASDPFRTEDKSKNITRVGDELAAKLESSGIELIHDRRSYDYPSYTGSYNRAYAAITTYLEKYPSIKLVIDLHRDSITAADGSQYKTIAQIGDTTCSQVMLVVGTDAAGLNHPKWQENMSLALKLQQEMNSLSPSLARPVRISEYRYNQHATTGSLIVEIGTAGNTLTESIAAAGYFAEAAANVILGLYK